MYSKVEYLKLKEELGKQRVEFIRKNRRGMTQEDVRKDKELCKSMNLLNSCYSFREYVMHRQQDQELRTYEGRFRTQEERECRQRHYCK